MAGRESGGYSTMTNIEITFMIVIVIFAFVYIVWVVADIYGGYLVRTENKACQKKE